MMLVIVSLVAICNAAHAIACIGIVVHAEQERRRMRAESEQLQKEIEKS